MADNCNFMASAFSENAIIPFCDLISVILGFQSVNGTQLVNIQSYSEKSYKQKNRILSPKDTRHVRCQFLCYLEWGALLLPVSYGARCVNRLFPMHSLNFH